jgi:hypothetical protein
VEILERLWEAVHRKRSELWPNVWILRHDNAPAYKALSVKQFLAPKSITEMEHAPCSPDLAPNDFCFQKWSLPSRDEGIRILKTSKKKDGTMTLKAIPQ